MNIYFKTEMMVLYLVGRDDCRESLNQTLSKKNSDKKFKTMVHIILDGDSERGAHA